MYWWILALVLCFLGLGAFAAIRTRKPRPNQIYAGPSEAAVLSQCHEASEVDVTPEPEGSFRIRGTSGETLVLAPRVATEIHRYLAPAINCACACKGLPDVVRTNCNFDGDGPRLVIYHNDVVILRDGANNALAFDRSACQKLHVLLRPSACACHCLVGKRAGPQGRARQEEPAAPVRPKRVFVSYLHGVHDQIVASLNDQLIRLGHSVWLDKVQLPQDGTGSLVNLDRTIADAVQSADALIVLVSKETFLSPRYAQREIRLAVALHENDVQAPEIIIVSVDSLPPPTGLAALATRILLGESSLQELNTFFGLTVGETISTLTEWPKNASSAGPDWTASFPEAGVTPSVSLENEEALQNWNAFMREHADTFHEDFFEVGESAEEVALKRFLRENYERSARAIVEQRYTDVWQIWAPVEASPLFDPGCEPCRRSSFMRYFVLNAVGDCLVASIFEVRTRNTQVNARRVIEYIDRLVRCDPFSLRGASRQNLSVDNARAANVLLMEALEQAVTLRREWADDRTVTVAQRASLTLPVVEELFERVDRRLSEVRGVLLGLEDHQ